MLRNYFYFNLIFIYASLQRIDLPNCLIYSMINTGNCIVCSPGYRLDNYRCDSKLVFNCTNTPGTCSFSCSKCTETQKEKCTECNPYFFRKNETAFPTECYSLPPLGYYMDSQTSTYLKCHQSCKECRGGKETDCYSCSDQTMLVKNYTCTQEISPPQAKCQVDCKICVDGFCKDKPCPENCIKCESDGTCDVCREGYKHNKILNKCDIKSSLCSNYEADGKCNKCYLGYSIQNNTCVCTDKIDDSYCCSNQNNCRIDNVKYIKSIDKCGCVLCNEEKFLYDYQCMSEKVPDNNCFIFNKNKLIFQDINPNECIPNFKYFKLAYNQFCLNERFIRKFPIEYNDKKVFIFSMNEKGVYQYITYSYPQEGIKNLDCNNTIHSYLYLGINCEKSLDSNFTNLIKDSKFLITNFSSVINNETIISDFYDDFFKAYFEQCNGTVNYKGDDLMKMTCLNMPSNLVDMESESCKSSKYCSSVDYNMLTFVDKNKCFQCPSKDLMYDSEKEMCMTYILYNPDLRNKFLVIYFALALSIFVISSTILLYLYFWKHKEDPQKREKIKDLGIVIYSAIDLCLDLSFFLSSSYINNMIKYLAIGAILLQPTILFFIYFVTILLKDGESNECNNIFKRICLALPMSILFTILSLLHLIENSIEIVNKTFRAFIKTDKNIKLWIKTSDLLLETIPEFIVRIMVIFLSKEYGYIRLIGFVISIIGMIYSIFYITSQWVNTSSDVVPVQAGGGNEQPGVGRGANYGNVGNNPIPNQETQNCNDVPININEFHIGETAPPEAHKNIEMETIKGKGV